MKQRNPDFPLPIAPLCLAALLLGLTSPPAWAQCDENATLTVGNATAESGLVKVDLRGSSQCPVDGLGMAIGHDGDVVEFIKFEPGPFLKSHAGSNLFVFEDSSSTFMNLLVVFDLDPPITVPPTSIPANTLLGTLTYLILPAAPLGPTELRNETNTFGNPPIANIYSTSQVVGGIRPILKSGTITVGVGETFSMHLEATVNTDIALRLRGAASKPLRAFSAFLTFDPSVLAVPPVNPAEVFAGTVWADSLINIVTRDNTSGTIEIQALRSESTLVPPGVNLPFANLTLEVLSCAGNTTIAFDDSGVVINQFIDGDIGIHDRTTDLQLTGSTINLGGGGASGFVRGNANGGSIDLADPARSVDLADAIFMLQGLFMGGQEPPCTDAADANDDGRYNLLDPIWVIQFLMGNAGSTLPEPFTQPGDDPTNDTLGCDTLPSSSCTEL